MAAAMAESSVVMAASGFMCAYDAVTYGTGSLGRPGSEEQRRAIPSCANSYLLNELARKTWGFDGCACPYGTPFLRHEPSSSRAF